MINKFENPIHVTESSMPPINEFKAEIEKIWESKWLTNMGQYHEKFKEYLKKYLKITNVELFTNGHLALDTAIKAMELKGEVITTPFTFVSTTHAIVSNRLKPVFCDIGEDFNIDVSKIEELITERTSAIIPVHVYGNPCDTEKISKIADKHDLKVIYDAAHAFGVEVNGKGIGRFGDISMFSCHATKVFNTIEGGILSVKDSNLLRKLYLLKNFGISGPETVDLIGSNAKMNEFQAVMGVLNLKYIDKELSKRKALFYKYKELLDPVDGIKILNKKKDIKYNFSYMPVVIDEENFGKSRDRLHSILEEYNVYSRKYFYPLTTDYECYNKTYNSDDTPNAKKVASSVLTLPLYASLNISDVVKICEIIKETQIS